MIDKHSVDLSEYRIMKAEDLLFQADILHQNKKFDGSINRSYYAIFNSIRSLLALVKLDSVKHSGIISLFDKVYVKTKLFDKKFSEIAHAAFDNRQENDYEDFYNPSEQESANQIADCKEFINEAKMIKQKIIEGKINLPQTLS